MTRGTFANVRIKNLMVRRRGRRRDQVLQPSGEQVSIYDASMKYQALEKTPLVILAGQEYGTGSSRDWAAKGTNLLGVKAVVAQSFERIHRSNLVGMGVLPLQFKEGTTAQTLKLDGTRDLRHRRPRREHQAAAGPHAKDHAQGQLRGKRRMSAAALIRPSKLITTSTAGFCRMCCGSLSRRFDQITQMFNFLRKNKQSEGIPKRLVFKNNESAFEYACKCLNTSLLDESPVLAIVIAVKDNGDYCLKISNSEDSTVPTKSPEEIIESGNFQGVCLSAKSTKYISKLKKGDLVMFVAPSELAAMGMGQMCGVIVAQVQPIYDMDGAGWVGV